MGGGWEGAFDAIIPPMKPASRDCEDGRQDGEEKLGAVAGFGWFNNV